MDVKRDREDVARIGVVSGRHVDIAVDTYRCFKRASRGVQWEKGIIVKNLNKYSVLRLNFWYLLLPNNFNEHKY